MTDPRRPHRPVRLPEIMDRFLTEQPVDSFERSELAEATAAAVIAHGRSSGEDGLVDLADRVGLDTLAALWRDEEPSSLAGALWSLYVLRRWCQTNGAEVSRLWRAGRPYAPADEVVAGVSDDQDHAAVLALADSVLSGAYSGEFDVALERAAAFFRVVALGRREVAQNCPDPAREAELADRNVALATALAAAAQRWREHGS